MAGTRTTRTLVTIAAVFAALVLLPLLVAFASRVWTDLEWYKSLGQQDVFYVRIASKAAVFAVASLVAFGVLAVNVRVAAGIVELGRLARRTAMGAAGLLAVLSGLSLSGQWMTFRLAVVQSPFGATDPVFGRDVGFWVFTLPALELLSTWYNGLVALSFIVVMAIVLLPARPGVTSGLRGNWWRLKSVLFVLAGFISLSAAFNYWLSIWQTELSSSGLFVGASYTDVHAVIPGAWVLTGLSVAVAITFFATARSKSWKLAASMLGLWAISAIVLGSVWPTLMQNYRVAPNETTLELPYLASNIEMTRDAFDLAAVRGSTYAAEESITAEAIPAAVEELSEARIWTPMTVKQSYDQLQTIRPYYRLSKIDTDRYEVSGEKEQVLVSAREMDSTQLPDRAQTWVNMHLVYTHGYGMVISSASGATQLGFPEFLVGNVPPEVNPTVAEDSPDLETTQPRIYYGPGTYDYVIVDTKLNEFDYPAGAKNVTCRYEADAGVPIDSWLDRLAWAIRLGSTDMVFSDYLTPDSKMLITRDVMSRVNKIAPWLEYDEAPYPALVEGRITWILDGYTSSKYYPYSQRLDNGKNYLRDSVKVTIDALTGDTTFYAYGDDPVRDAWAKIFPTVITPADKTPLALAEHFRYPQKMFSAQTDIYRTYHMTDPMVFYNKEDQWQIPGSTGDKPIKPTYLMVDLPDSTPGRGFYLMQPYAPANRDNLIGWMAAGCDPDDYGRQTVYLLPKERVTLGVKQVRARIEQDPVISPQLSLWDQRGSQVILGEMVVLPVKDTIVYVQPVFLRAEESAITELVSVVAVSGDRIEMGDSLSDALEKAFSTSAGVSAEAGSGQGAPAGQAALRARVDELLGQVSGEDVATSTADPARLRELQDAIGELLGSQSE